MARRAEPCFLVAIAGIFAGLAGPASAQQSVAPQAPVQTAAAAEPTVIKAETERKGRTGLEIFLGTYLTLSKDCKIGAAPKIEFVDPPKNGKIVTRSFPINLRDVPGAPKRTCIGTSPNGLAVIYRSERRFKGTENIVFRVVYPTNDIREVAAKVVVD